MAGQLRAPLVTLDPLTEGVSTIRAPLVTVDALSEGYRNLRTAFVFVEALVPVYPEEYMSNLLFPGSRDSGVSLPGLGFTWHKIPNFNTNVKQAVSGPSVRNALMPYPIWGFQGEYDILEDASGAASSLKTLMGFFLQMKGQFDTFLFKDNDDYSVTAGPTTFPADGVTTQFEFARTLGGFVEKVGQVDVGKTLHVYRNGVLINPSAYTVTMPNLIVFSVAPAAGTITADFEFFFVCKFKADSMDFEKFADKFWQLQTIEFESVPS